MFLQLNHQKLDAWTYSRELTLLAYRVTKLLPDEERFTLSTQIRRAALSVHLNISEGCSRKSSSQRKRYFEIARGSVVEVDAGIGIAFDLEYISLEKLTNLGEAIVRTFKILSGLVDKPG